MMPVRRTQNWLPSIFNDFFDNEWMTRANATAPAINVIECTIGLISTSIRPQPTAYMHAANTRPPYTCPANRFGATASIPNPIAAKIWATTDGARYPVLAINFAITTSTSICTKKVMSTKRPSCSKVMPKSS